MVDYTFHNKTGLFHPLYFAGSDYWNSQHVCQDFVHMALSQSDSLTQSRDVRICNSCSNNLYF